MAGMGVPNATLISLKRPGKDRDDWLRDESADPAASTLWSAPAGSITRAVILPPREITETSGGTLDIYIQHRIRFTGWLDGFSGGIKPGDQVEIQRWGSDAAETFDVATVELKQASAWSEPWYEVITSDVTVAAELS